MIIKFVGGLFLISAVIQAQQKAGSVLRKSISSEYILERFQPTCVNKDNNFDTSLEKWITGLALVSLCLWKQTNVSPSK